MMASRETTRILMLALCGLVALALWTDAAPRYAVHTKGKIGFIDRAGDMDIKPQFDDAIHFQVGVPSVKAGGQWRYVDPSGKWVISPRFDDAQNYYLGVGP